jgi:glycosyltransferase involved in cell wall biosynthesis
MKILFLTENFPPETNAAATRVYERAAYWARWGHEVTVLTCHPNFPQGRVFPGYRNHWYRKERIDGITVVRVKTFVAPNEGVILRTLDFVSFMAGAYAAGLFQVRPDVVVATSPQFFAAVGGWALAATRSLPFVFELGDLWPRSIIAVGAMKEGWAIRALERLELFLYRRAKAVVALSSAFRDDLVRRGIPGEKVTVVLNGVDLPRYAPRPRDPDLALEYGLGDAFVIGYVGTHGMAHGLVNVLDAADLLRSEERVKFLLVGAGAERQHLVDEAERRGLSNVIFMPPQPKDEMPRVWSLSDVALVHLRNSEAFSEVIPSKIFEAMGMGLPILLALPQGEASRIVAEEKAGIWVPADDPAALVTAVLHLMEDKDLLSGLAQRSLAAAPRHSREAQARAMLDVLARASAAPNGGA